MKNILEKRAEKKAEKERKKEIKKAIKEKRKEIKQQKAKHQKKLNKKKMVITVILGVILIVAAITMLVYYASEDARNFLDQYLFRKNVTQENLETIDLEEYSSDITVFAYNKYICVLAENKLMEYNSSGEIANEIDLEITNPIYNANNKYLAICESGGSSFSLISGSTILWSNEIEGEISKIKVNSNGYVAIVITGTTYKSVIALYDNSGSEIFKIYLSTTTAVDLDISGNNQYLAFAEVKTSGTTIQSNVKIVSIETAKTTPSESIIYTDEAETGKLIVGIKYQGNDKIVCMYDDEITMIHNETNTSILSLSEDDENINFANINLDKYIYRTIEETQGLFNTNTVLEIENTDTNRLTVYTVEGAAKYVYSSGDIIAIDLGQEVEFVNTSGWLKKRYYSEQEVQDIVIGNGLAGIVFSDRVEIVNL